MRRTHCPWRPRVAVLGAFVLAACGAPESTAPEASTGKVGAPSTSAAGDDPAPARIELPVSEGETVEGLLDVGGHDIYARCSGSGAPTVVSSTGWVPDESKRGVDVIKGIEALDDGRRRICSYERRNTGRSERVEGTPVP